MHQNTPAYEQLSFDYAQIYKVLRRLLVLYAHSLCQKK